MQGSLSSAKINLIVFPYRDLYFFNRYGNIVRDLHILNALKKKEYVKRLVVVNRPVSIYERFLGKKSAKIEECWEGGEFWDLTSMDFLGPFKGRGWTEYCYNQYIKSIKRKADFPEDEINILLDFTPIAKINYQLFSGFSIWYDFIDNFRKHNRFSAEERRKVSEKYSYVKQHANLLTGVTEEALSDFPEDLIFPVANGLVERSNDCLGADSKYTYGFIGFLTDKFDADFLEKLLANTPHKAAIYGKVFDSSVKRRLLAIPNVDMFGEFKEEEVSQIMSSYKIGLLPYLSSRSHDGSPIKLYSYLDYGKPVITTMKFELNNEFIIDAGSLSLVNTKKRAESLLQEIVNDPKELRKSIRETVDEKHLWDNKVDEIIGRLLGLSGVR